MKYIHRITTALPFNEVWLGRRKVVGSAEPMHSIDFDTPLVQESGTELTVRLVLRPNDMNITATEEL